VLSPAAARMAVKLHTLAWLSGRSLTQRREDAKTQKIQTFSLKITVVGIACTEALRFCCRILGVLAPLHETVARHPGRPRSRLCAAP
jgi:hypothetical protein